MFSKVIFIIDDNELLERRKNTRILSRIYVTTEWKNENKYDVKLSWIMSVEYLFKD